MFTGLITQLGKLIDIKPYNAGVEWTVAIPFDEINLGASISINGVCSTVKSFANGEIKIDYLPETLKKTTFKSIEIGSTLNIEPSLKYGDEIGGHLVTGHIDTTGEIKYIDTTGDFHRIRITYPHNYSKYIISKGSVAIDGISLTVVMDNEDEVGTFEVHIIPHTWSNTRLSTLKPSDRVNLEFDQVGKYEHRRKILTSSI
jgi:riboflavin synthase